MFEFSTRFRRPQELRNTDAQYCIREWNYYDWRVIKSQNKDSQYRTREYNYSDWCVLESRNSDSQHHTRV